MAKNGSGTDGSGTRPLFRTFFSPAKKINPKETLGARRLCMVPIDPDLLYLFFFQHQVNVIISLIWLAKHPLAKHPLAKIGNIVSPA